SLVIARRGKPDLIVSDHGTEFTSNAMLAPATPLLTKQNARYSVR
ncbi:hypothetical protein GOD21_30870, partial [Sinorhizobium medicae]|nr:hypothetical protein [Sinorhizobium medicae]